MTKECERLARTLLFLMRDVPRMTPSDFVDRLEAEVEGLRADLEKCARSVEVEE